MVPEQHPNDEITLREILIKFKDLRSEVFRKWKTVLLFFFLAAVLGFAISQLRSPEYAAKLSFVVQESEGGGALGKYASLMSQFGVNLGGMTGEVTMSEDNLMELLKSRVIVEQALLKGYPDGSRTHSLADKLLDILEWRKAWELNREADTGLPKIAFPPASEEPFSRLQDSVMTLLYDEIFDAYLTVEKLSSQTNIIVIACNAPDPEFPKYFCEYLIGSVSDFYVSNKTQKARETLSFVSKRADSVRTALSGAELQLARWEDSNRLMQKAEGYLAEIKLRREVSILNVMYAEIIKNLEMSKMVLLDQTPVIQVIDKPVLPLEEKKISGAFASVAGGMLGLFLGICFVIIRKTISDAMAS